MRPDTQNKLDVPLRKAGALPFKVSKFVKQSLHSVGHFSAREILK